MDGELRSQTYHIHRQRGSLTQTKDSPDTNKDDRSSSFDAAASQDTKLPMLRMKKVMRKIGAVEKGDTSYIPSDEDQTAFRKSKWHELRQQYSTRRSKQQPFDYELDEIVLGCWEYGESFGRKTIWRKYKQKFDELTFDTLRVVRKKKM